MPEPSSGAKFFQNTDDFFNPHEAFRVCQPFVTNDIKDLANCLITPALYDFWNIFFGSDRSCGHIMAYEDFIECVIHTDLCII